MSNYLMTRNFDRLFDDIWGNTLRFGNPTQNTWRPTAEVEESEQGYTLSFEVPGVAKERLQVEVKEDVLSVSGESKRGQFRRSFTLPPGIDASKIEATHEDGVLTLSVPKAAEAKPRQIAIGTGSRTGAEKTLSGSNEKVA